MSQPTSLLLATLVFLTQSCFVTLLGTPLSSFGPIEFRLVTGPKQRVFSSVLPLSSLPKLSAMFLLPAEISPEKAKQTSQGCDREWVPIYLWVWLKRKSRGTRGPRKQNLVSEDLGFTMRTVISQSFFIPASSCFIHTPSILVMNSTTNQARVSSWDEYRDSNSVSEYSKWLSSKWLSIFMILNPWLTCWT